MQQEKKYLVFDSETNGKIKQFGRPMTEVDNFPRIAELAWAVYDANKQMVSENVHLVLPDGWEIPKEQFFINNGMSTERNMQHGIPISEVLAKFIADYNECEYLIAHNFAFDYPIVGAEMIRQQIRANKKLKGICTMEATTDFCKLPGKFDGKYKWPKLEEVHEKLFNQKIENVHEALGDVRTTARVFFELLNRKIINL